VIGMENHEFDRALIAAAFEIAAEQGWGAVSVPKATRRAGLDLGRSRERFSHKVMILRRFGRAADRQALAAANPVAPVRDQIFDMVMARIDALQAHRGGVLALFRALPANPALALLLAGASVGSMGWLLEAAGVSATGPRGRLRAKGLFGVWLWTVRAWGRDESADLAPTMAALDQALTRAQSAEAWLHPHTPRPAEPPPFPEPSAVDAADIAPDVIPLA
jgi:ubiquinone biosynthesis protein COQ9